MAERTCGVEGCTNRYRCRGYCEAHSRRLRRYGDPLGGRPYTPRMTGTESERFWAKVDKDGPNGCWIWTAVLVDGYGRFNLSNGKLERAHRITWIDRHGFIPVGRELDHLCRNPACCNPDHLEPVTHAENLRRSQSLPALNARKTHCHRGHPFDEANTWVSKEGHRHCRKCRVEHARGFRKRHPGGKARAS